MFTAKLPHVEVIGVQILDELVQPLFPFVVSRLGGDYPERIDIAHLIVVDGPVDFRPTVGIGTDDVRNLQSGDIERLAGRESGDGMPQEIF